MAPITLLNKGSLVARMGENQHELDKLIPIEYIMDWFDRQLNLKATNLTMSDRVVILLAKTGSGKSTSIAPNLYLRFYNTYKKRILITQPRVLTAIEIPKDISELEPYKKPSKNGLKLELFKNLGYQTQEFVKKTKDRGILFITTGILLQYLKTMDAATFIKKYKFIIIDEAHDRSLDVDLILFMMKKLIKDNLSKNPPFLILMSATLNADEYLKYFETNTIFEVKGQSKPIDIIYPKYTVSNIFTETCDIVKSIQMSDKEKDGPKDIIIFMPNTAYILNMASALEKINQTLPTKFLVITITSMDINIGSEDYRRLISSIDNIKIEINGKKYSPTRRVIVSTNVAETGLTLEGLKYCIDSGLVFSAEFNPRYGSTMLIVKPTTSSMSLQRKGRIGRKYPGTFYPLFTEKTFDNMIVDNTPSILIEDITTHLLAVLKNDSINSLYDMITPPSVDSINYSLEKLYVLGAIDANYKITKTGELMNLFRKMNLETRKMILSAFAYKTNIEDILLLSCLLNYKKSDLFITSRNNSIKPLALDKIYTDMASADDKRLYDIMNFNKFKSKLLIGCEFIEILLIYNAFSYVVMQNINSIPTIKKWCYSNGLNYVNLIAITESVNELHWQLIDSLQLNPYNHKSEPIYKLMKLYNDSLSTEFLESVISIKKIIYEGYKMNLLIYDDKTNEYYDKFNNKIYVNSKLVNTLSSQKIGKPFIQSKPKYILYKDLLIKKDLKLNAFIFEASVITILDGFIDIDLEFSSD